MSDIYGKLTEHPEYPITDSRRFTIEIKVHKWEAPKPTRDAAGQKRYDPFCARCGYSRLSPVHPAER